eukprot:12944479-Ditylum_brightwellii.AAC.1
MPKIQTSNSDNIFSNLKLHPLLQQRIHQVHNNNNDNISVTPPQTKNDTSFVLYLPTVLLRKEHNPAFALACHIANSKQIPLIILAVVLDDDHHHPHPNQKAVAMTSRRLSFTLEALYLSLIHI